MELPKIKITIIKKTLNKDLINEFVIEEYKGIKDCEKFENGQEFVIDPNMGSIPEGFCNWAWADIRTYIHMVHGGQPTMLSCCTDGARPVFFKIERVEL